MIILGKIWFRRSDQVCRVQPDQKSAYYNFKTFNATNSVVLRKDLKNEIGLPSRWSIVRILQSLNSVPSLINLKSVLSVFKNSVRIQYRS
jgi:hypothetical protein